MKTGKSCFTILPAAFVAAALLSIPAAAQQAQTAEPAAQAQSNQPVDDSWITTKVKTELLASKATPGTRIEVDTKNGVVTLSGTVDTQEQADRAVATARAVDGVHHVEAKDLMVKNSRR